MFDAIKKLLAPQDEPAGPPDTRLSVAALLVHLSHVDGVATNEERAVIEGILSDEYDLSDEELADLIAEATRRDADAVDLYQFTSSIVQLDEKERENIIRLMWQLVYADRDMHEMEDNMVWRVAELIGVSPRRRMVLRNQMRHPSPER